MDVFSRGLLLTPSVQLIMIRPEPREKSNSPVIPARDFPCSDFTATSPQLPAMGGIDRRNSSCTFHCYVGGNHPALYTLPMTFVIARKELCALNLRGRTLRLGHDGLRTTPNASLRW
jgi:hypothetical protein